MAGVQYSLREGLFTYYFKLHLSNVVVTKVDVCFVSA